MKYLFLDIDGVLNHQDWYQKLYDHPELTPGPYPMNAFDPECVKRINEILEMTGAKIVVSSSWRGNTRLKDFFWTAGLPTEFDVTPRWKDESYEEYDCRGEEIQAFLNEHECENYVILDDDNDMLDSQRTHFVRTCAGLEWYTDADRLKENGGSGLTESLKNKVIEILNKKGDD